MPKNISQIRWKRGDYISLGKAVSAFNKKVNELNNLDKNIYLPELKNYTDIKNEIGTRKDLRNTINSLRSFLKEGAEEIYTTEARRKNYNLGI